MSHSGRWCLSTQRVALGLTSAQLWLRSPHCCTSPRFVHLPCGTCRRVSLHSRQHGPRFAPEHSASPASYRTGSGAAGLWGMCDSVSRRRYAVSPNGLPTDILPSSADETLLEPQLLQLLTLSENLPEPHCGPHRTTSPYMITNEADSVLPGILAKLVFSSCLLSITEWLQISYCSEL